jgi:ABC-2 type transport system permease protein
VPIITNAPAMLRDDDQSEQSQKFVERIRSSKTFAWRDAPAGSTGEIDLLKQRVLAAIIIPPGWGKGLSDGEPKPVQVILDGTDTTTAPQLKGAVQEALGTFQIDSRQDMIDQLPDEVFEMGKKLPQTVINQFTSAMEPWSVESRILYNPRLRFIDFVMSGIVGLILQLLTVTLMACTIAREREAGTLAQLLVSPLRRGEIVVGKVLPYLVVSVFLIGMTLATGHFHFHVEYRAPLLISLLCFFFLLCSLGTGLLISAFCHNQAQAIQFAVFYLLPVFPLSGAFATLDQLPPGVRLLSEAFPLTHFCRGFRLVCLGELGFTAIAADLAFLCIGAIVTCAGAAFLLRRVQD